MPVHISQVILLFYRDSPKVCFRGIKIQSLKPVIRKAPQAGIVEGNEAGGALIFGLTFGTQFMSTTFYLDTPTATRTRVFASGGQRSIH